jgi:hypothetical protein
VVAALAAVGWWATRPGPQPEAPVPTAPAPAQPAPAAKPPAAARSVAPTPVTVEVRLRIDPEDARVEIDGVPTKDNPIRLPHSERQYRLTVSAPGFAPESRDVTAAVNSEIDVKLERITPRSAKRPATPRKKRPSVGPVMDDL